MAAIALESVDVEANPEIKLEISPHETTDPLRI
jgi:hypothetical protein